MANETRDYLSLLSELFPNIASASTEIINLASILNLPKGTEHFVSDLHGSFDAFSHVLRNGSGSVRRKIEELFGRTLAEDEIREIATLIYYPKEKIDFVRQSKDEAEMDKWYKVMLYRLIAVCRYASSKYTRSKVRKALPEDFRYVIEELITEREEIEDKELYYEEIVHTIIRIGSAERCITALSQLIQRLVIDHLHVVGDIFDRGDGADQIMDVLSAYHSFDIQWGNHDILWMGASLGQRACVATVVRICARYGNMGALEDGYGINVLPLATFAQRVYADDPCEVFQLRALETMTEDEEELTVRMHKAIAVIQFKLEALLLSARKEFHMEERTLLNAIDFDAGTITIEGKNYPLTDTNFPTIDPAHPFLLTEEEEFVIDRLCHAFMNCERLQKHMLTLLNNGGLYKIFNGNLLYHGCVPLQADGMLKEVDIYGRKLRGKALYDGLDGYIRRAFFSTNKEKREMGKDLLWWLWCSKDSPLFGKDKMTTFERYFIADKETHEEHKNSYFALQEDREVAERILADFGLVGEHCHIINGHVPVRKGQDPVKADGKLIVIDGGFSKAYQKVTAIAGYTLVFNSHGMTLVAHTPFDSREEAVRTGADIHSTTQVVERAGERVMVGDTDTGAKLKQRIKELEELLEAYRSGEIVEKK